MQHSIIPATNGGSSSPLVLIDGCGSVNVAVRTLGDTTAVPATVGVGMLNVAIATLIAIVTLPFVLMLGAG